MASAIDCSTMTTVRKYRPTGFDHGVGVFGSMQACLDWLVSPIVVNRDSKLLEQVNWKAQCKTLEALGDEELDNWRTHSFGHWACGWYEILIVKPGTKAYKAVAEMECELSGYPILDDSAYSDALYESVCDSWHGLSVRDRYELIKRAGYEVSVFAARHPYPPEGADRVREILERWAEE